MYKLKNCAFKNTIIQHYILLHSQSKQKKSNSYAFSPSLFFNFILLAAEVNETVSYGLNFLSNARHYLHECRSTFSQIYHIRETWRVFWDWLSVFFR